jgi:hypothetical protein
MTNINESEKDSKNKMVSIGKTIFGFMVAFVWAGILVTAIQGVSFLVFLGVIGKFPMLLELLSHSSSVLLSLESIFNISVLVISFISARRVYYYITRPENKENSKRLSIVKLTVIILLLVLGLVSSLVFP